MTPAASRAGSVASMAAKRIARLAGGGKPLELALVDELNEDRRILEHELDLAGHHVDQPVPDEQDDQGITEQALPAWRDHVSFGLAQGQ